MQCEDRIQLLQLGTRMEYQVQKVGQITVHHISQGDLFYCIGRSREKEKEAVEALLADSTVTLQKLYEQTQEGNGQRWLMIDLEDQDALYQDTLNLIKIRSKR